MRSEADLIPPIRRRLARSWKDTMVFEEFGVGYGVADVVAACFDQTALKRRNETSEAGPLTRRSSIRVLDALQGGPLDLPGLEVATRFLPTSLRREIRTLTAAGFLIKDEDGLYRLRHPHSRVVREVWAVEAKVHDWLAGMRQARRYQGFADRVYLAVDQDYVHRVDARMLRSFNVGLMVVGDEARIVEHPLRTKPSNTDLSALTSEKIWSLTASGLRH